LLLSLLPALPLPPFWLPLVPLLPPSLLLLVQLLPPSLLGLFKSRPSFEGLSDCCCSASGKPALAFWRAMRKRLVRSILMIHPPFDVDGLKLVREHELMVRCSIRLLLILDEVSQHDRLT